MTVVGLLGGYANVQATDKLSFNLRGEVYDLKGGVNPYSSDYELKSCHRRRR
jgi:hypothetical protein